MSRQNEGLRSGDRHVLLLRETHVSGRKVDRRVLAVNDDAELGLITCVWDRTGQMARQSIPEWREAASVVSEAASEEKIGGNGVERTVNKDMTNDGMIFEAHKQIVKL